jgi:hypothetical protein
VLLTELFVDIWSYRNTTGGGLFIADETGGGGGRGAIASYRGPAVQKGGPTILRIFLSFSVVSLFVDLQIHFLRLSPSHSATESVFMISCKDF